MKVYGGRRMCDLFALKYACLSYSTIKRDNKKEIQHVPSEHGELFIAIEDIFKDAKAAHGIIGPVSIIEVEDEMNVRSRISFEQRFDIHVGLCGLKGKTHVHI